MTIDFDDAEQVMKHLDTECWQCGGSGKRVASDCDVCYGTGYQPTRAGIELLNFLKRQGKRVERTGGGVAERG
jgi:DnaJ-class molecular chaperone